MWKKDGGRFAGVPGKKCGATLNGNVVLNINSTFSLPQKNKVKLSRLGGGRVVLWFVFLRFQPSGGRRFFFPCV